MNNEHYIKRCFELARKGYGKVSPNPLVGAVIVKDGRVVSEGYHEYYGGLHAEANAIKNAKEDLTGATIYCNLEPCCHTKKKTPPCTPAIIKAGIKKVVISNVDPNPQVAGNGVKQLRDAGIEVVTGILEDEGAELNKFFFFNIKTGKPYVMLKIAQSIDGYISKVNNEQTWLTNEESKKDVHFLRSIYDAVLIGASTANVDNPSLTVREVEGRNPKRIIIDGKLSVNPNLDMFKDAAAQTIIFTSEKSDPEKIKKFNDSGIIVEQLECKDSGIVRLESVINVLNAYKISSLMVEGGATVFSQFLEEEIFNEIILFIAPKVLGNGVKAFNFGLDKNLKLVNYTNLNSDLRLVYER